TESRRVVQDRGAVQMSSTRVLDGGRSLGQATDMDISKVQSLRVHVQPCRRIVRPEQLGGWVDIRAAPLDEGEERTTVRKNGQAGEIADIVQGSRSGTPRARPGVEQGGVEHEAGTCEARADQELPPVVQFHHGLRRGDSESWNGRDARPRGRSRIEVLT